MSCKIQSERTTLEKQIRSSSLYIELMVYSKADAEKIRTSVQNKANPIINSGYKVLQIQSDLM